jgi:hypothetical protein
MGGLLWDGLDLLNQRI